MCLCGDRGRAHDAMQTHVWQSVGGGSTAARGEGLGRFSVIIIMQHTDISYLVSARRVQQAAPLAASRDRE